MTAFVSDAIFPDGVTSKQQTHHKAGGALIIPRIKGVGSLRGVIRLLMYPNLARNVRVVLKIYLHSAKKSKLPSHHDFGVFASSKLRRETGMCATTIIYVQQQQ